MTRTVVFAAILSAALPLFAASDVLTVGSLSAARGTVAAVPVYVRDLSGSPLGMDQAAANRIQGIGFKVTWSPASAVSAATFTRGGVLQGLTALYETTLTPAGSLGYVASFAQSTNPIPFVSNAAAPGSLIGYLNLTIPQNVAGGTAVSLTVDATMAALSNQAGTVIETGNNGKLSIANGTLTVTAAAAGGAPRGDFNGNGRSDLWWRNTSSGDNYLWYTSASAFEGGATPPAVPTSYAIAGTGDFNNDGRTDVLWRNASTGSLSVWFLNGGAIIGGLTLPSVTAPQYVVAGVGDFNGDGYADLLWRDTSTGGNSLWYITAGGFNSGATLPSVPTDYVAAAVADFNGDGRADIFWRNNSGANYIWAMNGAAIIGGGQLPTVPTSYSMIGAGDFNADGKHDVVWRNPTSGDVSIWYINGSGLFAGTGLNFPPVPPSYNIAAIGDFNGDGAYDLMWRNPGSGDNSIWLINNGFLGGIALPNIAGTALQVVAPK